MAGKSPFSDDWRDCLSAHFTHVIRTNDVRTEPTLTGVLLAAGFTEAELRELKLRATMHVDDVPADFVPDLEILQTASAPPVFAAVEVPPPAAELVAEEVEEDAEDEPPAPHDEDGPVQLSLF
jgi:hypothetical protein